MGALRGRVRPCIDDSHPTSRSGCVQGNLRATPSQWAFLIDLISLTSNGVSSTSNGDGLSEELPAGDLEIDVRQLLPPAACPRRKGCGVAGERHPQAQLFGKLPDVGERLHLRPRQVRARPDVGPKAAVELALGPPAEPSAECAPLGREAAEGLLRTAQLAEDRAEAIDRLLARPGLRRANLRRQWRRAPSDPCRSSPGTRCRTCSSRRSRSVRASRRRSTAEILPPAAGRRGRG